jgi:hypothetical protein
LNASDISNLTNNTAASIKANVDGGSGYDTLRVSGSGENLNLSKVSNVSAMANDGSSRINSIERIDLGSDTTANKLTLTDKDVNDMAGFNLIRTGGVSADGNTWTNVTGTPLAAANKFHQLVLDGTTADSLALNSPTAGWADVGQVSNGSSNYTVYQNTATNSQVLVKAGVAVATQAVAITNVKVDVTTQIVEEFGGGTMSTDRNSATLSTVKVTYEAGSINELNLVSSTAPSGLGTDPVITIGSQNQQAAGGKSVRFDPRFGMFGAMSFQYSDVQDTSANYSGNQVATVNFYDANGNVVSSQGFFANTTGNGQTLTFTRNSTTPAAYFKISGINNDWWQMDTLAFTPVASTLATDSSTTDTTPQLNGNLATALTGTQSVHIFDGATDLGVATVTGTSWTYNVAAASVASHNYVAKVFDGSSVVSVSQPFKLNVVSTPLVLDLNGDGVQTTSINDGTQFDLLATGSKQNVGWVSKQDGLLAMDLNDDGQINSGAELFGDHTQLADGSLAKDGWAALRALDSNQDGKIDAQDAKFNLLRVWEDADGDGTTDAGELHSLVDAGVASINLVADNNIVQQNGNVVQAFSTFTSTDGSTHQIADVGLAVKPTEPITHIDMAADTVDNTLNLTGSDVKDIAGFNVIRIGSTSADGKTWSNVSGSALSATSEYHQLVLDGEGSDVVNLKSDNGSWVQAGTVNDGSSDYVVWQNNTTASQVLVKSGMEVNSNVAPAAFDFNTDAAMDYNHTAIQADLAAGHNSKAPAVLSFEDEGFEEFASMQGLVQSAKVRSASDLAIDLIGMGDDGVDDASQTSADSELEASNPDTLTMEVVTAKVESAATPVAHDETGVTAASVIDPNQHLIDQTTLNAHHNG